MTSGDIFDIKRFAIHDGPGIRTAVFLKGCPLACLWCHNPEGQRSEPQLMFRANRCKGFRDCIDACPQGAIRWEESSVTLWERCDGCGKCAQVCYSGAREMVGRTITVEELVAEVERDIPFYDQSGGGVTFTGGEPMYQLEFLHEALRACKEKGMHTVVDTSGYAAWEEFEQVRSWVDLFLYDLKIMDETRHIKYTGASNRIILDNLRGLIHAGAHVIVRIPVIPGINDDEENIDRTLAFLASLPSEVDIELLPYHTISVAKYQAMGMKYPLEGILPATEEEIARLKKRY
jgi:pyruvate formate lyase activating enzyme